MRFGYTLLKHGRKSKPTRIIVIAQRPMYLDKNYDESSILSSIKNIFVFSGKIPIFAIVFEPKLKAS